MKVAEENNIDVFKIWCQGPGRRLPMRWLLFTAFLLLSCCSTAFPARGAPAPAVSRDLLAHGGLVPGGEDLFWVARVFPNREPGGSSGSLTRFFAVRASESKWQQWGEGIPLRAISLASRGSQLAVLLDDGTWVLLSEDASPATGQRIGVSDAALVCFADDGRNLWALAKIPGGVARLRALPPESPVTIPSTGLSIGTTGPSTGPSRLPALSIHPTTLAAADTQPSPSPSTEPIGPLAVRLPNPPAVSLPAVSLPAVSLPAVSLSNPSNPSNPLIGPAPEMAFGLVSLGADGWVGEAEVPLEIARPGDAVSLALIDGESYLAVGGATGPVRVFRLPDAHHRATMASTAGPTAPWALVCAIDLPDDAQDFQLLNGTPVPTLWVRGRAGPDLLYLCKSNAPGSLTPPPAPVVLESTRGAPPGLRAAAYALGLVRSIFVRDGELYEQSYDRLTGAPPGAAAPLPLPGATTIPLTLWRYALVTGAMLYAIGASFRRREQLRSLKIDPDSLPLAPAGARLLAGAIDALPVIAAWAFYYERMGFGELMGAVTGGSAAADNIVELVLWASFAIYLLHTTLSEVFFGRTLGKVILGLRVTTLNGKPPTRGQMLTRNLLRVIDAGLVFLPVLLVPFSPLRQRAGDTAAGTVVLSAKPRPSEDDHPGPVNPP